MNKIDILSIGDIATDIFIKITEAEAKCDVHGDHCKLCLNYGGKIPYESVKVCHAVGNSSNFSIGISKLGIKTAIVSSIGNDQNGIDCLNKLKNENVVIDFINIDKVKPTSNHYVLCYEKDHTILTKHEEYKYEWPKDLEKEKAPAWIYLSSLGKNAFNLHDEIINYLERNPSVKLAFQPGTLQIRSGIDSLKEIYKRADILFCNHSEAREILNTEENNIEKLIKMLYALGPKNVIITDGINGSFAYQGEEIITEEIFPSGALVETTGAGDAFSSAFMTAFYLGNDIKTSLKWGSINASSVISYVGPHEGLLTRKEIENKLGY